MFNNTLSSVLLAGLALVGCGSQGASTEGPPDASSASTTSPGKEVTIEDLAKVEVNMFAGCFMRNEKGNIWYISAPSEVQVSMEDVDLGGALETGFAAKVRAERSAEEIGEYASRPSCFVGSEKSRVQSQMERYTGSANEPGNKVVTIDYRG